jgi:hypothetical protein
MGAKKAGRENLSIVTTARMPAASFGRNHTGWAVVYRAFEGNSGVQQRRPQETFRRKNKTPGRVEDLL